MIDERFLERFTKGYAVRAVAESDLRELTRLHIDWAEDDQGCHLVDDVRCRILSWARETITKNPESMLILLHDGVVAGKASIYIGELQPEDSQPTLCVWGLYVDVEHRTPGAPLAFFRAIYRMAQQSGARIQFVESLVSKNKIPYLERLGCKAVAVLYQVEV